MGIRSGVSLTIKLTTLILTVVLALDGTGVAQEIRTMPDDFPTQVLDEKALKVKVEVTRRYAGAKPKVRVKLRDKHQLTGRIIQADEYSFQIQVEPALIIDVEPAKGTVLRIPYAEVDKIRGARSRPAKVLIDVGVVVGVVVLLAALVVGKADQCRRGPCL